MALPAEDVTRDRLEVRSSMESLSIEELLSDIRRGEIRFPEPLRHRRWNAEAEFEAGDFQRPPDSAGASISRLRYRIGDDAD